MPRNPPNPVPPSYPRSTVTMSQSDTAPLDWRVSLDVPVQILEGDVLDPLKNTNNRMIFPFTPSINIAHTANYSQITPVHTNYAFNAYQNSRIENIQITGVFVVENEADAKYWLACLHFLRTMTKMFYGEGQNLGNPPLVSRLNGYGKHVLNNIPVLINNFTVDLKNDVDYIPCTVDGQVNYVPVNSTITVTCMPNYARRSHSRFDLGEFAKGSFVNGPEGFV